MTIHRTTIVSVKGQVVLPKATRDEMGWQVGDKLRVQRTPDGVLLSEDHVFPETEMASVFGCLPFEGPVKSIEDMDAAILKEARRQA